jgi:hypothetical protein
MESQDRSSLNRRRLMQLGTLSLGGVLAASATAYAGTALPGPGQDGTPHGDPRLRTGAARTPAVTSKAAVAQSYNGWPVGTPASVIGVQSYYVTDTSIALPVRSGDVAWVLMYVAARFNAEVEKLRPGQDWGYDYRVDVNNRKWWSCHASGTAVDFNAVLHPNGAKGTFTSLQVKRIRNILADCQGVVYWGGDFSGVPDEMHFEINVPPGDPRLPALVAQIRGVVPPPPHPPVITHPTRVISLRAGVNQRFVTADLRSALPLIADRAVVGGSEQFEVVTIDAGHVALRARANNRFVCAEHAGASALIANRDRVGRWETFAIVSNPDRTVSLQSAVNGRFVTAEYRGAGALIANRTATGSWEKFTITG